MEHAPDAKESSGEWLVDAVIVRLSRNGDVGFRQPETTDRLRTLLRESSAMRAVARELVQIPDGYVHDVEHRSADEKEQERRALALERDLYAALGEPVIVMAGQFGPLRPVRAWLRPFGIDRLRRRWLRRRLRGSPMDHRP